MDDLPPLSTGEPDSFGNLTMRVRIPSVIRTVAATNPDFAPTILAELERFAHEVETGAPLRPLAGTAGAEQSQFDTEWQRVYLLHAQAGWLRMPWYAAEAYMYRCLLDITLYYAPGGRDPFAAQKEAELRRDSTWSLVRTALAVAATSPSAFDAQAFSKLLRFCVLGNKADLCYTKVASTLSSAEPGFDESLLLVNDEAAVAHHVDTAIAAGQAASETRLNFAIIVDNSGAELLCDLVLCDFLLAVRFESPAFDFGFLKLPSCMQIIFEFRVFESRRQLPAQSLYFARDIPHLSRTSRLTISPLQSAICERRLRNQVCRAALPRMLSAFSMFIGSLWSELSFTRRSVPPLGRSPPRCARIQCPARPSTRILQWPALL